MITALKEMITNYDSQTPPLPEFTGNKETFLQIDVFSPTVLRP